MKKYFFLLGMLSILFFSGCKKEVLDFSLDTHYDVKQFLKSKNCDTECEKAASCEGKIVRLRGLVDLDFAVKENGVFILNDINDDKYQLQVKIEDGIVDVVFYKLEGFKGKVVKVEGMIEGFDAPTNFDCDRKFILKLTDDSKVTEE